MSITEEPVEIVDAQVNAVNAVAAGAVNTVAADTAPTGAK